MSNMCMPCEKQNHTWCLYEVVDTSTGEVVPCQCIRCNDDEDDDEEARCDLCATPLVPGSRSRCGHRPLCQECVIECRECADDAARDAYYDARGRR